MLRLWIYELTRDQLLTIADTCPNLVFFEASNKLRSCVEDFDEASLRKLLIALPRLEVLRLDVPQTLVMAISKTSIVSKFTF